MSETRISAVEGNSQWLDGGAMFGNVPRALWEKWVTVDAQSRIRLTLTRLATPFQSWQRHARAEELGFRDFSSLFLVKESRRQLGNSACCISCMKVSITSRVFA